MTAFDTDVSLEDIAIRNTHVSGVVDEPVRAMILDMLAGRELDIADIHETLAASGYDRTENTVRHHLNELRDAGLVEVARLEERRGGTAKYYRANTILLSYGIPDDAESRIEDAVDRLQPQMNEVLEVLHDEYDGVIDEIAAAMAPCAHCRTQKYELYLFFVTLRRAFVRAQTGPTDGRHSSPNR